MSSDSKKYDRNKPWWQNIGCSLVFTLSSSVKPSSGAWSNNVPFIAGTMKRIDVNEYRKYVVVEVEKDKFEHINIDHIVSVKEK